MEEKREFIRQTSHSRLQIYTGVCLAAYTVDVKDISPKGAFLATQYLPDLNEVINFNIMDQYYSLIYSGNATVVRVEKDATDTKCSGFAVEFFKSVPEEKLKHLN